MNAMILAAGRGKRMMPLTQNTPKSLLKVKGIALIEHSIQALKKANITKIVINTAYLGEKIQSHLGAGTRFGVQIIYSTEKHALETAGGIIKALPLLGNQPFVVINSDILCDYDLSKLTLPKASLAHLLLIDNPAHHPQGDFGLKQGKITLEDKKYTFAGIGIYHPDLFKSHLNNTQKLPLYPLLKTTIEQGSLSGEYHSGYWQDIGTPQRLEQINHVL